MLMKRELFLHEVDKRLRHLFAASKEGFKAPPAQRHRLEGFMQAGVFLELASHAEMAQMMDKIHHDIFGNSIAERKAELPVSWPQEPRDYSQFEQPSYLRNGS